MVLQHSPPNPLPSQHDGCRRLLNNERPPRQGTPVMWCLPVAVGAARFPGGIVLPEVPDSPPASAQPAHLQQSLGIRPVALKTEDGLRIMAPGRMAGSPWEESGRWLSSSPAAFEVRPAAALRPRETSQAEAAPPGCVHFLPNEDSGLEDWAGVWGTSLQSGTCYFKTQRSLARASGLPHPCGLGELPVAMCMGPPLQN